MEASAILFCISLSKAMFDMQLAIDSLQWKIVLSIQGVYIVLGLVSTYMLQDVKREHKNKLGSFQEVVYFYT